MNAKVAVIVGLILLVVALVAWNVWTEGRLMMAVPQQSSYGNQGEAIVAAWSEGPSGSVYSVLGTGSMWPYIPKGRADEVVAYALVDGTPFESLQFGDLVIASDPESPVSRSMHQVVMRDGNAWILAGLNNPRSDRIRMTVDTFIGRVCKTYVW